MTDLIRDYLPWLLSVITIWMTLLAGNKTRWAWAVGLGNQALWLIWIIAAGAWGLLPMNIALWVVYTRNHLKWNKAHPDRYRINRKNWTDRWLSWSVTRVFGIGGSRWAFGLFIFNPKPHSETRQHADDCDLQ